MVKFFAFILVLLLPFAAHANRPLLVPVFTPTPEYPDELIKTRYTGKVRVSLTVGSAGTIQAARVIESSHPKLAEAAQRALVQWRFESWDTVEDAPATLSIMVPIIFGARGIEPFLREITVGLGNILCAYLNYEVKTSRLDFPKEPLSNVDVFWYTREYLSGHYITHLLPEEEERQSLLVQLGKAIPKVVKECRRNPDGKYGDYLPREIRAVLVGPK